MLTLRTYLKHQAGTYSCVKPSADTVNRLQEYINQNLSGVVDIQPAHELHCTVVYSTTPAPLVEVLEPELPIQVTAKQFSLFGEENDVLVLEIESPELVQLFNQSSDLGATSDWPNYKPHITLASNATGIDLTELPAIEFDLIFDQYFVDALD